MKFNVDDLIEKGLVTRKEYIAGKHKGLSVLKYHKKVFYNNLWGLDDRLLECRGIVVDKNDNIIVRPFKKVFNKGENGTMEKCTGLVMLTKKYNGFMAALTKNSQYGKIVSTTGTLCSDYVKLAKKYLDKLPDNFVEKYTYLFEICDSSDPHIVDEHEGAYLIGVRDIETGRLVSPTTLSYFAGNLGVESPSCMMFRASRIDDMIRNVRHEGFMVTDLETHQHIGKVKSPYYLSKKALMRLGKAKVDIMYNHTNVFKQRIDEEFYDVLNYIVNNIDKEVWRGYNDQQRKQVIEEYFYG